MHTAKARDGMVKRVQKAFKEWPTFGALPEVESGDVRTHVRLELNEFGEQVITEQRYVEALYACAGQGAEIVGRRTEPTGGNFVIGKDVEEEYDPVEGDRQ